MAAEAPGNYMMQRINVGKTLGVLGASDSDLDETRY